MMADTCSELRRRGFRMTPQRLVILEILQDLKRHVTALQVYQLARQAMPGITEATVYRTLSWLAEQGLVMVAHIGGGQLEYEIAGHNHHHIICRACGRSHEIDHADLEKLYHQLETETGYHIDSVHVTFFGLCSQCL